MRRIGDYALWIGNRGDLSDPRALHTTGIEAIVDLAGDERPVNLTRDLLYCRFPLVDGSGNSARLVKAAIETTSELIRSEFPLLVACSNGMNRSPAVAAAAISRVQGCSLAEALNLMKTAGSVDISPGLWSNIVQCSS